MELSRNDYLYCPDCNRAYNNWKYHKTICQGKREA